MSWEPDRYIWFSHSNSILRWGRKRGREYPAFQGSLTALGPLGGTAGVGARGPAEAVEKAAQAHAAALAA
jgi:hypothetical protein